jgi:hypothetical protein
MNFLEVAGRIGNLLCAACTSLERQVWTFGAGHVIRMAIVSDGGMSTAWTLLALKAALRGTSAAWLRGLQSRSSTRTAYVVEDGLGAAIARAAVAELLAVMITAFEWAPADPETDMLGLNRSGRSTKSALLPGCLSLICLLLARAAMLAATVTSTAHVGLASPQAERVLNLTLMTDGRGCGSAASARNIHGLVASWAITKMALGLAQMSTGKQFLTGLVTVRNIILTRFSRLRQQRSKWSFSTWAVRDDVDRKGAVRWQFVLRTT